MGRSHTPVEPESHWRGKFSFDFSRQQHAHACTFRNGNLITFYHDRFYCITIPFSYREAAAASYILGDTFWVICCFIFSGLEVFFGSNKETTRYPACFWLVLCTIPLLFWFSSHACDRSKQVFPLLFSITYGEGFLNMACTGFLSCTWKRRHFGERWTSSLIAFGRSFFLFYPLSLFSCTYFGMGFSSSHPTNRTKIFIFDPKHHFSSLFLSLFLPWLSRISPHCKPSPSQFPPLKDLI